MARRITVAGVWLEHRKKRGRKVTLAFAQAEFRKKRGRRVTNAFVLVEYQESLLQELRVTASAGMAEIVPPAHATATAATGMVEIIPAENDVLRISSLTAALEVIPANMQSRRFGPPVQCM